ncbi:hypothetical protein AB0323_08940 [Arthrobacter sp. NPDC080031]|uniref:hypothetical protein n=1 Tax=Arthrobacter sp. NPDC080031 TaxID=3155918 RepID=UPI00344FF5A5
MFKTETRRRLPVPLQPASSPLEWRVPVAADRKLRPHPAGIVVVEFALLGVHLSCVWGQWAERAVEFRIDPKPNGERACTSTLPSSLTEAKYSTPGTVRRARTVVSICQQYVHGILADEFIIMQLAALYPPD